MLITWFEPSAGASSTQPLMLYSEPTYILLLTLICGPSKFAVRPVISSAFASLFGAGTGEATVVSVEPARELQPSRPPSANVVVIPELSCWLTVGGAGESSPMTTSSI